MGKKNCPKCDTDANVVKLNVGYRCAFCGTRFYDKEGKGQQKLI